MAVVLCYNVIKERMVSMGYLIVAILAYLVGCSNMAVYLAKLRNVDLKNGSGNPGTSNATILMGWGAGVLVGIHDIGKGILAVLLAELAFPQIPYIGAVAGVACVLGHIFPAFMKFKGGKGFASFIGMTVALNWKFALIILAVVVIVTLITDYLVVGTVTMVVATPVVVGILAHSVLLAVIICVATAVILYRHRENYTKIRNGTEIGLLSTIKGKNRVK
jgi:glycerol-3-phosphate acyltransferase PlsY